MIKFFVIQNGAELRAVLQQKLCCGYILQTRIPGTMSAPTTLPLILVRKTTMIIKKRIINGVKSILISTTLIIYQPDLEAWQLNTQKLNFVVILALCCDLRMYLYATFVVMLRDLSRSLFCKGRLINYCRHFKFASLLTWVGKLI